MMQYPKGFKLTDHDCHPKNKELDNPIEARCKYSTFGWILFSVGVSAKPIRVDFVCLHCGKVIQSTTDSKTLTFYVGR
jgi:hypothetical protein